MKIKSNKSQILSYNFSMYVIFTLIISTIVLYIGNGDQVSFSQGYITPVSDNSKSKSFICPQIAYSGPTYTGPDGCPKPCPTSGDIPQGCPVNPIGKGGGILIGNQSGQTQTNIPSGSCPPGVETFAACNLGGTQDQKNQ